MTVPQPPQREHGRVIENRPCPWDSTPRPWQTGQTIGSVPGSAPVPRQVGHGVWLVTATGTWAPVTACENEIETSVSRSRPRSACGLVRVPVPLPPKRPVACPKRSDRMSEKPPMSAPPAPPAAPGPAGPAERRAREDRPAAVVLLALVGVREDVVGLRDLLEALLRLG